MTITVSHVWPRNDLRWKKSNSNTADLLFNKFQQLKKTNASKNISFWCFLAENYDVKSGYFPELSLTLPKNIVLPENIVQHTTAQKILWKLRKESKTSLNLVEKRRRKSMNYVSNGILFYPILHLKCWKKFCKMNSLILSF